MNHDAEPDRAEEPPTVVPEQSDAPAISGSLTQPLDDQFLPGVPGSAPGAGQVGQGQVGQGGTGDGGSVLPGPGEDGGRGPLRTVLLAVREIAIVVVLALGLSLLIKTFLVQAFYIPSESMESTLVRGDRVMVSKLTPGPFDLERGDIIVFKDPGGWLNEPQPMPESTARKALREGLTFVGLLPSDSGEHLIKRVIGLPGDKVECCDEQGRLQVNGEPVDEPYLYTGDKPSSESFSITVPADRVWVMGDHRSVSQDSRAHQGQDGGTVPMDNIVGRAFVLVWPLRNADWLSNPGNFSSVPNP